MTVCVLGVDTGRRFNGLVLVGADLQPIAGCTLRNRSTGVLDLAGLLGDLARLTDTMAGLIGEAPAGVPVAVAVEAITPPQALRAILDALAGRIDLDALSERMAGLAAQGFDVPALDDWLVPMFLEAGAAARFRGAALVPAGGHGYRHRRLGLKPEQCYPRELVGNRPPRWAARTEFAKGDRASRRDEQAAYDVALKALGVPLDEPDVFARYQATAQEVPA